MIGPHSRPTQCSRFPTPHEAYGLCAVGLPHVKAIGLAVVFDHATSTLHPRYIHATSTPLTRHFHAFYLV